MSGLRRRCDSKWQLYLVVNITAVLFTLVYGYDPCPESLRQSPAARPLDIPEEEVDKAFEQARARVHERRKLDNKLVSEGRIVNKKIKSSESVHPPANASARVYEGELTQLEFHEASNILAKKYKLTAEQVACGLPKLPLRQHSARGSLPACFSSTGISCIPSAKFRTADGSCNNLNNPTWGKSFSCFARLLPPDYSEGIQNSVLRGSLPAPRYISQNVYSHSDRRTNNVNHMYMVFGRLLQSDITLTSVSTTANNSAIQCCPPSATNYRQCTPIEITSNNGSFDISFNVTCLNFVTSAMCPFCTMGPRTQVNEVTAFIDGSFVYGNSLTEMNSLRTNDTSGKLITQSSPYGDLLPSSNNKQNDRCSIPAQILAGLQGGDVPVNQNVPLTALRTCLHREHNRLCDELKRINPQWSGDIIFQEAKRIIGALLQVMTYKDYLPVILGDEGMSHCNLWISNPSTYDPQKDPTLYTEFSTAAFRFFHTIVDSNMGENPQTPNHSGRLFRDFDFRPFALQDGEMEALFEEVTTIPAQLFDSYMSPDVTNFLYRIRGNYTGLDLASFDIQRGRDHEVPPYHKIVNYCSQGQITIRTFNDLVDKNLMSSSTMSVLQQCYKSVYDIDAYTGIICENSSTGAVLGPTAICIIGMQFSNLKRGDRFYFDHSCQAGSFTPDQRNALKKCSLAKVICDNTAVSQMPLNALLLPCSGNPMTPCSQIPGLDLSCWKQ